MKLGRRWGEMVKLGMNGLEIGHFRLDMHKNSRFLMF